jgi:tRNA-dihydrouridine synthase
VAERFAIVLEHARNAIEFEADERRAIIDFRKHLGWYTKGLPDGKALREALFQVSNLAEVERMLDTYASQSALVAA